jgi:hypothetical protein
VAKKSKKLIWKVLSKLPEIIRFPIIRSMFKIEYELPSEYVFKIAETEDEISQAFRVLHDGYVEQGLMDSHPSKLRITKYHSLPTTTLLIFKLHEEVIATMTVISDTPMGLPLEACWSLSSLRDKNYKLMEVSALAIKNSHRSKGGKLLFPLCKFMWEYAYFYAKSDGLVISVNALVKDFYQAILCFERFEGSGKKSYGFVKGDIADAVWLNLSTAEVRYKALYGKNPVHKNMHRFFFSHKFANFVFPERKYFKTSDPKFTPELINLFFKEKMNIFESMTPEEKLTVKRAYFYADYVNLLDGNEDDSRQNPRFPTHCPARFALRGENEIINVTVDCVSRSGLGMGPSSRVFDLGTVISLNIDLGPGLQTSLEARVIWSGKEGAGLEITKVSHTWLVFIDTLEEELKKSSKKIAA